MIKSFILSRKTMGRIVGLLLSCLVFGLNAWGQNTSGNGWSYDSSTDVLTISSSDGFSDLNGKSLTPENVVIANGVTEIPSMAFQHIYSNLKSLKIASSVTTIISSAFLGCNALETITFDDNSQLEAIGDQVFSTSTITSIKIPASVKTIGDKAFYQCQNLTTVTFEDNSQLKSIGKNAFAGDEESQYPANKSGLTSIKIPKSVTSIDEYAFYDCPNLANVEFEEGIQLKTLSKAVFKNNGLTSITIPASVEEIGEYALGVSSKLTTIVFAPNSQLKTIKGTAFGQSGLTEIDLPNSVTTIDQMAFALMGSLETIIIPSSVTDIGNSTFAYSTNLTKIIFEGDAPTIGTGIFENIASSYSILVPLSKKGAYKNVTNLSSYSNNIFGYSTIKITDPTNGTLKVTYNGQEINNNGLFEEVANQGTKVSVAFTPDPAYEGGTIYATDASGTKTQVDVSGEYDLGTNDEVTFSAEGITLQQFTVTITQPDHGTIKVFNNQSEVSDGDKVDHSTSLTVTLTPDEGYRPGTVYANGTLVSGSYTVTADVTFTARGITEIPAPTPEPTPEPDPVYYTVTLPAVEGVTTDPEAGDYEVERWDNFHFNLTLLPDYDGSHPVVTTSLGETLEPDPINGAYVVKYLRSDVVISIGGIVKNPDPVGNEIIREGLQISVSGNRICIETDRPETALLYNLMGQLVASFPVQPGENYYQPQQGSYIIAVGECRRKLSVY